MIDIDSVTTYKKVRRLFINKLIHLIKERDEAKIGSIFCELSKTDSKYLVLFIEQNKELCTEYINQLLNETISQYRLAHIYNERIIDEVLNIQKYSSAEVAYYLIIYITVEEFNIQLRKFGRPYEDSFEEENLTDSRINHFCFFRGQTQGWDISPSVLRKLNENIKIDKEGLMHLYDKCDLNKKYNELYCDYVSKHNSYYKIAFMQHACAFSPMIDFSKKAIVATSFALSNTNQFNVFNSEKSYVYRLVIDDTVKIINSKKEASDFIDKMKYFCIHINDSFTYCKTYYYDEYVGGVATRKSRSFSTPIELFDALKPKLVIIDSPTNDRMKYQSGIFAMFYEYVSFKGELKYWYAPGFSIIYHAINPRSKRKLINIIHNVSEGWYAPHLLSEPYDIFNR